MNTLQLYYSYIKNPFSTQISTNEKIRFILDVYNCTHNQTADELFLLVRVFIYYFIIQDVIPLEKYTFTNETSRGPPNKEVEYVIPF